MVPNSALIRDWLGAPPYLFAFTDTKKFTPDGRGANLEAADFIAPPRTERLVFNATDLAQIIEQDKTLDHAIVVLHPYKQRDLTAWLADARWPHPIVSKWQIDGAFGACIPRSDCIQSDH